MAIAKGYEAVVKVGSDTLGQVTDFSFNKTVDSVETDPHVRQALGSSLNLKSIQEAEENKFTKKKK